MKIPEKDKSRGKLPNYLANFARTLQNLKFQGGAADPPGPMSRTPLTNHSPFFLEMTSPLELGAREQMLEHAREQSSLCLLETFSYARASLEHRVIYTLSP